MYFLVPVHLKVGGGASTPQLSNVQVLKNTGGGIQEIYQNILGYTFYSFGFVSALLSFCCSESSLDIVLLLLLLLLQLLFATKLLGFEI